MEPLQEHSTMMSRPMTFRVENIPPGTSADQLKQCFYTEDQPQIDIRSIAPAVDNYELDIQEYTATITFQPTNSMVASPRVSDDTISIDSDFHGFTPLYHPQEAIAADIIAVTGLAAHAFGSWAHTARKMWLRDYLPRDINNARVLIYGYPSQLQGNISRSILSDHSTNLIHRLLTMRESAKCQNRPIVFIGHSLGCLIIKKALCDINGSVGIYSSRLPVRSIIFLGAPHKGLHITALATLVESQPTEDMVRELKAESPTLTELNDKFRYVAKDMDILTCYELSPTKTAIKMPDGSWKREGPPEMMVSLDSARQWYPREKLVACNADHSQIAKLKRGESGIWPEVKGAIKKAMLSAGDLYSDAESHREKSPLNATGEPSKTHQGSPQALDQHRLVSSRPQVSSPATGESRSFSADAAEWQRERPRRTPFNVSQNVDRWQSGLEDHERSSLVPISQELAADLCEGLTAEQLQSYKEDGILIIPKALDASINHRLPSSSPSSTALTGVASSISEAQTSHRRLSSSMTSTVTEVEKVSVLPDVDGSTSQVDRPNLPKSSVSNVRVREAAEDTAYNPSLKEKMATASQGLKAFERLQAASSKGSGSPRNAEVTSEVFPSLSLQSQNIHRQLPSTECVEPNKVQSEQGQGSTLAAPLSNTKSDFYGVELEDAIFEDDLEKVQSLLETSFDVNCKNEGHVTPLHTAVKNNRESIVRLLLKLGADPKAQDIDGRGNLFRLPEPPMKKKDPRLNRALPDSPNYPLTESLMDLLIQLCVPVDKGDNDGYTPLMCAATAGEERLLIKLIENGANVAASDNAGITALHSVVTEGKKPEIVTFLISKGASVDAVTTKLQATPLHFAGTRGPITPYPVDSVGMMEHLLRAGANIEARDDGQKTPLIIAARSGKDKCVSFLLKSGANIEAMDKFGMTPLHNAADCGHASTTTLLIEHGANKEAQSMNEYTALHCASSLEKSYTARVLIEHGANLEAEDQYGRTPLHHAVEPDVSSTVALLVEHSANKEARDQYGQTALLMAACRGSLSSARELLEHGADKEAKDRNGLNVLSWATHSPAGLPLVKLLLEHGANKEATDRSGGTALHHAVQNFVQERNIPMIELFIKEGANLEAEDWQRYTAIFYSVSQGDLALTELLHKHGARLDARSRWGVTPLHVAVRRGDLPMVKLLLNLGADPCAKATHTVSSSFKGLIGAGGAMPRGYNEPHKDECPQPKREEIKNLLKEAEKSWRLFGKYTPR